MASPVGAVYVELGVDTAAFNSGMKQAAATAQNFGREVGKASAAATANARNLAFQLVNIGQSIPLAFQSPLYALQNLGFQIAQIGQIYAGQGGMRAALTDSVMMVGRFAVSAGPMIAAVAAIGGAFAGLGHEINETSDVTVGYGDTALAVFQVVRDGITDMLQPAVESIAPWFATAWDWVVEKTTWAGDALIKAMQIAAEAIAAIVATIPDMFEVGWNGAVAAASRAMQKIVLLVDSALVSVANRLNETFGTQFQVGGGLLDIWDDLNVAAGEAETAGTAAGQNVTAAWEKFRVKAAEIAATDPLGDFFTAVGTQAEENARARLAAEAASAKGGGGKSAAERAEEKARRDAEREAERLQRAYEDMILTREQTIAQQEMEYRALGMTEEAANRLRHEFDFLADAQRAGIELTPQQTARLRELSIAVADAETRTSALEQSMKDAKKSQEAMADAIVDVADSFANAALHADSFKDALENIGIELLKMAAQGFANKGPFAELLGDLLPRVLGPAGGAPTGGGGAPISGSIGSGIYAKGGAFLGGHELTAFARGGIVSRPTVFPMARGMGLMGEAGPEAVMPLRRGPDGRLGVAGGGTVVNVYAPPGSSVSEERSSSGGMEKVDIYIEQAVARGMRTPGSPIQRALSTSFGARPVTTRR